jgi:hypothetical protein
LVWPLKIFPVRLISYSFFLFTPLFIHTSADAPFAGGGDGENGRQQSLELQRAQEKDSRGIGTLDLKRPDGGKDKYYYSITTEEEENEKKKEESKKLDQSLEMLDNVIILDRGRMKR